jgi:hypothetical protein
MKKSLFIPLLMMTAILLASCGTSSEQAPTPTVLPDRFADIPQLQRITVRGGDPRSPGYWALWNTCAEDNRADVAAANGGRAAGWVLMDDLLAEPGIQIGDLPVTTCEDGLALLQRRGGEGGQTDEIVYDLAAQLLATELNLNLGAETCPIAEEAVLGGHIILAEIGFDGAGSYGSAVSDDLAESIPRFVELLAGYNSGSLCINP